MLNSPDGELFSLEDLGELLFMKAQDVEVNRKDLLEVFRGLDPDRTGKLPVAVLQRTFKKEINQCLWPYLEDDMLDY